MTDSNYQFGAGTLKDLEIIRLREKARKEEKWSYEWPFHYRYCHQRYPPSGRFESYLNSISTLNDRDILFDHPYRTTMTLEEHLARVKMIKDALALLSPPATTPAEDYAAFMAKLAEYQAQIPAREAAEQKQREDIASLFKTLWPNLHASLCPPSTADIILSEYEKKKIVDSLIEAERLKNLPPPPLITTLLPPIQPPPPPYHGVSVSVGLNYPSYLNRIASASVTQLNPISSYDQSTTSTTAPPYLIDYDKINADLSRAQEQVRTARCLNHHRSPFYHSSLADVSSSEAERRLHRQLNHLDSKLRCMNLQQSLAHDHRFI